LAFDDVSQVIEGGCESGVMIGFADLRKRLINRVRPGADDT
jgi:hypothetical protein